MNTFTVAEQEEMLRLTGGVDVVFEGQSTVGHLDFSQGIQLDGEGGFGVVATEPSLVIPFGALAGLQPGKLIQADGDPYIIRYPQREEDGGLQRVFLKKG